MLVTPTPNPLPHTYLHKIKKLIYTNIHIDILRFVIFSTCECKCAELCDKSLYVNMYNYNTYYRITRSAIQGHTLFEVDSVGPMVGLMLNLRIRGINKRFIIDVHVTIVNNIVIRSPPSAIQPHIALSIN